MKETHQEQLIAVRRNQILDSAAKVFAAKGFHPTTIRDIAREAGIADGTIYNYFENKSALLLGIFERMREVIQPDPSTLDLAQIDLREFLRMYFRYPLMALQGDNFALFRVIASEMLVNETLRTLYFQRVLEPTLKEGEQLLQQWVDRHELRPHATGLTLRVISGVIWGVMLQRIMGDPLLESEWETLPDFLADLFLEGLGSDPI